MSDNPMNDEPKATPSQPYPNRGRFQFHLSTAFALLFASGVLIWANLANGTDKVGWPEVFTNMAFVQTRGPAPAKPMYRVYRSSYAVYDGVVGILILLVIGFFLEARAWGWSAGKIFVWVFLGIAVGLQIIVNLRLLLIAYPPNDQF